MKYLTNYTEAAITKVLDDNGAFFAFSNGQFDKAKKDDIKYASLGAGLIAPKENAKAVFEGLDKAHTEGIAQDLKENGKDAIIKRELSNHECYYVMDPMNCKDALAGYGVTDDEIRAIYNVERLTAEV